MPLRKDSLSFSPLLRNHSRDVGRFSDKESLHSYCQNSILSISCTRLLTSVIPSVRGQAWAASLSIHGEFGPFFIYCLPVCLYGAAHSSRIKPLYLIDYASGAAQEDKLIILHSYYIMICNNDGKAFFVSNGIAILSTLTHRYCIAYGLCAILPADCCILLTLHHDNVLSICN